MGSPPTAADVVSHEAKLIYLMEVTGRISPDEAEGLYAHLVQFAGGSYELGELDRARAVLERPRPRPRHLRLVIERPADPPSELPRPELVDAWLYT